MFEACSIHVHTAYKHIYLIPHVFLFSCKILTRNRFEHFIAEGKRDRRKTEESLSAINKFDEMEGLNNRVNVGFIWHQRFFSLFVCITTATRLTFGWSWLILAASLHSPMIAVIICVLVCIPPPVSGSKLQGL